MISVHLKVRPVLMERVVFRISQEIWWGSQAHIHTLDTWLGPWGLLACLVLSCLGYSKNHLLPEAVNHIQTHLAACYQAEAKQKHHILGRCNTLVLAMSLAWLILDQAFDRFKYFVFENLQNFLAHQPRHQGQHRLFRCAKSCHENEVLFEKKGFQLFKKLLLPLDSCYQGEKKNT